MGIEIQDLSITGLSPDAYNIFYTLVVCMCLAMFVVIFVKMTSDLGNKGQVHAFKGMILCFSAYCIIDLAYPLMAEPASVYPAAYLACMMLYYMPHVFALTYWLIFVEHLVGFRHTAHAWWRIIRDAPFVVLLLMFLVPLAYPGMLENGGLDAYRNGILAYAILIVDSFYMVAAILISLNAVIHEKRRLLRRQYLRVWPFAAIYMIGAFAALYLIFIPVFEIASTLCTFLIFVTLQSDRIDLDALTKLNNRRRIDDYLETNLPNCSDISPLWIFMIDLDFFKHVNDELGHLEGDRALKLLAEALRRAVVGHRALIGRWGGDEFVIMGTEEHPDPEKFAEYIRSNVKQVCKDDELGFVTPISIGFAECHDPSMGKDKLIELADSALYVDKQKQHQLYADIPAQLAALAASR